MAAWAVLVLGMAPLLLPGLQTHASVSPPLFPARLGSSAWMWEDVAWWWWLVPVPWPHPGAHDQHGIAVAEPRHGSGAGKPSPCPLWAVWLCHPLPCGAFPLPGVSQTLARPLLLNSAGTGGHEPGQPPAHSACWHVPRIGQSHPRGQGCCFVVFEGRPRVDTAPRMVWWGQSGAAGAGVGATTAQLAGTVPSRATCSFLLLPILLWLERGGHRLA